MTFLIIFCFNGIFFSKLRVFWLDFFLNGLLRRFFSEISSLIFSHQAQNWEAEGGGQMMTGWNPDMYAPIDYSGMSGAAASAAHSTASSASTVSSCDSTASIFEFPDYRSPEGSALLESEWLQQQQASALLSAH
jgi:hypothetical protein